MRKHRSFDQWVRLGLAALALSALVSGGCLAKQPRAAAACLLEMPIEAGTPGINRLVYVLFDLSRSTARYHRQLKAAVKEGILEPAGPGDWVYGFQLETRGGPFSEENIVFAPDRTAPLVPENLAQGTVGADALARGCGDAVAVREELKKSWDSFEAKRAQWAEALERTPAQSSGCCSAYLASLRYLGQRLANAPRAQTRWLFVLGDLKEEPLPRGKGIAEVARELARENGKMFQGVNVRIVRTATSREADPAPEWQGFFQEFGAADVRTFYLGEKTTAALDATRVPTPASWAGTPTASL